MGLISNIVVTTARLYSANSRLIIRRQGAKVILDVQAGTGGGEQGDPGLSAYQVAVANGFVGTEAAWLASLVGAPGNDGEDGIDGLDGTNGTNGTNGTDGDDGQQGIQGIQGIQGEQGIEGPAGSALAAWPVGSVYIAVDSTSPATRFGGGTWAAIGAGRVLVGINGADPDFDTAEETGGAKTQTPSAHAGAAVTCTVSARYCAQRPPGAPPPR